MKRFLLVLLLALFAIANNVGAQDSDFDVWNFVTTPQEVQYDETYPVTLPVLMANARKYLPGYVRQQVGLGFPMISAKLALLAHSPNAVTQSIRRKVIPADDTAQHEARFLSAYIEEVRIGYPLLDGEVAGWAAAEFRTNRFPQYTWAVEHPVNMWVAACKARASKIVERMAFFEGKRMAELAADVDFIRKSARVSLAETPGMSVVVGAQDLRVRTSHATSFVPLKAQTTFDAFSLYRVSSDSSAAAFSVTAKNAPVVYAIGNASSHVLTASSTRAFSSSEIELGVHVETLLAPVADGHIDNQTLSRAEVQTVSFLNTFEGKRKTYSVESEQTSVVTVRLTSTPATMAITGVGTGTANVVLTCSNEAGSATVTFAVTVQ